MATLEITAEVVGLERAIRAASEFGERAAKALAAALYRQGESLMTDAKKQTPVETGNLRASGHVRKPEQHGNVVVVELGFGGIAGSGNRGKTNKENVGYAVYVHEDLQASHWKTGKSGAPVQIGKPKYLEDPYRAKLATIDQDLAEDLRATWLRRQS